MACFLIEAYKEVPEPKVSGASGFNADCYQPLSCNLFN